MPEQTNNIRDMQTDLPATELSSPEDKFVQAVKAVAIFGKFPKGLNFGGKRLVTPHKKEEEREFGYYSPSNFSLYLGSQMTYPQFIRRCLAAIEENRGSSTFPQAADLMKKHFLAITPYMDPKPVEDYKDGYSLLIYSVAQDARLSIGGRWVRSASVSFLMSTEIAQQFIQLIEQTDNGADLVERFVQKAAPGVMANNFGETGIYRIKADELIVLDKVFIRDLLTARDGELLKASNNLLIGQRFLGSINKAVVKRYSQPSGFGISPS